MTKYKKQTIVDFSDIFYFAEKSPFNIDWNTCNELFFDTILTYKSTNNFYQQEAEAEFNAYKNDPEYQNSDICKAWEIINAFMIKENLKEMLVLND